MARLNIEDSLFSDSRFIDLCVRLKSEIKAIGWWVKVARLAQSYWKNGQELIPDSVYKFGKFPSALIDSGIIEKRENGYYLKGSEQFFAWIFSCVENGRKGGRPRKDVEIIVKHETHGITHEKPTQNLPTLTPTPTHKKEKEKKEKTKTLRPDGLGLTRSIAERWNFYAEKNYLQKAPSFGTKAFEKYHKAAQKWLDDYPAIDQWEKIIRVAVKQENTISGWRPDYMHIFRNTNPHKYLTEFEINEKIERA